MKKRTSTWIVILLTVVFGLWGCQRRLIKGNPSFRARTVWSWGGNPERTGWSKEEIHPPLKLEWTYKADAAVGPAMACADDYLFFGIKSGVVTILDLEKGKRIKTLKIEKQVDMTCLVDEDRLIIAQRWKEPSIRSISFITGKPVWTNHLGSIVGEPLLVDNHLFAGNERGEVFLVDADAGNVIWKTRLGEPARGSVALSGNTLICVSDGGKVWSLSGSSGSKEWKRQLSGSLTATPVLSDDMIFVGTTEGMFTSLFLNDGTIVWEKKVVGGIYEKAALDDSSVYFGTTQGVVYCLNAMDGSEIWRFDTHSVIGTSLMISGRWVYFGTLDGIIYALDKQTGIEAWQFRMRGRVRTTPLVWKGMLVGASEDRYVYGFVEDK